jgi:hypothetical protein
MSEGAPRWQSCSICREIPALAHASWNGVTRERESLPAAASKLVVVGAPYFNDYQDRCKCTKRCPECGTTYSWDKDYEMEVAAMVDTEDIWLRRLDDAEGVAAVESAMAEVARRKQQFQIDGAHWVSVLLQSNDQGAIERAADNLLHHQTLYDEDLAFAVPGLVRALVHHVHTDGWTTSNGSKARKCLFGSSVTSGLETFASRGDAQRELVVESLKRLEPKERRPEIKDLLVLLRAR